jgi:hypothetical protein
MGESYLKKMIHILKNGAEKHLEKPGTQTIHIKSEILFGDPAEQIVDYAVKSDIDLIVMSTHVQSGKYDGKIPGEITIPDSSALKCNIIWNKKWIHITGVDNTLRHLFYNRLKSDQYSI